MIKIRFFSSFCTSEQAADAYKKVYMNKENWYEIVCDDSYTHAVVMNTAMPNLSIPKENVIGVSHEPIQFLGLTQEFIEWAKIHLSKYLIGFPNLPKPFVNYMGFQWFVQERNNYFENKVPEKIGKIAIWCSQKLQSPGHKYRHLLVQKILNSNLPIDIYGRGCVYYKNQDPRIKGSFDNDEPYKNYEFCISIENFESDNYISEKFLSCIAYNTIPIYLGAKNVDKYFGDNCCIKLSGEVPKDMIFLRTLCEYPYSFKYDLKNARYELFEGKGSFEKFLREEWLSDTI